MFILFGINSYSMKHISIILLFSLLCVMVNAQQVITEQQARQTANAFLKGQRQFQDGELQLVEQSNIFIFTTGQDGFVIVSGNTVLPPILAYSAENAFPSMESAPDNLKQWVRHYSDMIDFANAEGIVPEAEVQQMWDNAARGIFTAKNAKSVNPLVNTRWNQDCYYNEYCPEDNSGWGWWGPPCQRAYAGCVACAMAQVMKYWDYPQQGFGSHSYTHSTYGVQSADFGATTYRWDEMPDEIFSSNDAIATLMYHCGVSVDMNYGPEGSGAQSRDVETAMRSYFGYCGAKYREKSSFGDAAWIALLKTELDAARPIYYSGNNGDSGHAFVCDGYDDNDRMHFNFGWSGSGDGFYSIYDVNGFSSSQAAVVNVYPMDIHADANGIIYVTPDGEGNGSSWSEATSLLHYATSRSIEGVRIWVKKGTYTGDDSDSTSAFQIVAGNRVYGGFNGDEGPDYDLSQRDFANNASILDGQNIKRVLNQSVAFNAGGAAVWDGFTLQNGQAGSGAGAYLGNYMTLENCRVCHNNADIYGGGIYINSTGGIVRAFITNCSITDNSTSMGAGVCDRLGATYTNCIISNNISSTKGGGMYIYASAEPLLKGCLVCNNTANEGAALYARGQFTATNCNFVMNEAIDALGGIFNENRHNKYTNCILWGNTAKGEACQVTGDSDYEYCAVEGGINEGTANEVVNLAPNNDGEEPGNFIRFVQPAEGSGAAYGLADWSLMPRSIALNAGKPNTTGLATTDLNGNPRLQNGRIEIGACESCSPLSIMEETICNDSFDFNGTMLYEPGYYTTAYETSSCDSVVGLHLEFSDSVMEVSIEGDTIVNLGESATLIASGAVSYRWSTGETTATITVSPTEATRYSVTGYNEEGCSAQASVFVEVMTSSVGENGMACWIYPNPSRGEVTIEATAMQRVTVINILGQVVFDAPTGGDSMTLDLTSFGAGIYMVRIATANGTMAKRVGVE